MARDNAILKALGFKKEGDAMVKRVAIKPHPLAVKLVKLHEQLLKAKLFSTATHVRNAISAVGWEVEKSEKDRRPDYRYR